MESVKLKIGDIVIEVCSEEANLDFPEEQAHKRFVVEDGKPYLSLKAHYGKIPEISLGEKIFDSGGVWKLFSNGNNFTFTLTSPPDALKPYSVAVLEKDFRNGEIYFAPIDPASSITPNPLNYPMDELLMVNILAMGKGVLLHSNCINDRGCGMLFTGTSGAGKSTMAEIWKGKEGVNILTDERVIIRRENGNFFAYGTPWHGTAMIHSPDRADLKKIFFIKHGKENSAKLLDKMDATSRFLVRAFPTYWNQKGMEFTLELASKVIENIPCYELAFKPDESIIEFVRNIK